MRAWPTTTPRASVSDRRRRPVVASLVAALVASALLCGVSLVAAHSARQTVLEDAARSVTSNRDGAVRALTRMTDDYKRVVTSWAADPALAAALTRPGPAHQQAAQDRLAILSGSKGSPAAFLTDLRARTAALYPSQPELIGKSFAFRDWFQGVSRTGTAYVSSGYGSAAAGHPLVVGVSAPVNGDGGRLGYLTVLWQLDSVRDVVDGSRKTDGVSLTVADQLGQSLTDPLVVDERGQPVAGPIPPLTRAALDGRSTSTRTDSALAASAPVTGVGWSVTASLPTDVAVRPALAFQRILLGALAVALVLVLACTVVAIRVGLRRAAEGVAADQERHRLAALFSASPIGIVEGLPDGRILGVNEPFARMLGYEAAELIGRDAHELAHPDAMAGVASAMFQVREGTLDEYTCERHYLHRDGTLVPVLVSVVVLREPDGQVLRMVAFVVDQRQQHEAAEALRSLATRLAERESFLSTLFDTMDVAVLACDTDGALTMANNQTRFMHGLAPTTELDAPGAMQVAHLDGTPMTPEQTPLTRALTEGVVRDVEMLVVTEDGSPPTRVLTHARRMTDADGNVLGAVIAAHDVTAIRAAEVAVRASEERFRRIFDEGLTGKLLVDATGCILEANATLVLLLGPTVAAPGRQVHEAFAHPEDRLRVQAFVSAGQGGLHAEMALVTEDQRELWGRVALSWVTEQSGALLLLMQVEDVTARRAAEERLTELALHDDLTGLPNRRLLLERCDRAFAAARSTREAGSSVAVLFIDLDGFKPINDRAGHEAGDQLLVDIARDLQAVLRPHDTVARVGGDEFVVLLERHDGLAELRQIADRISSTIRRPVPVGDVMLAVSASIGIARADLAFEPEARPDQLLRRADAAMYRAKERGKDRHDVFDEELRERTEARQELESALREGLRHDRVALVFQPVVDVDSLTVVGAEALMRLTDGTGRLLPTLPAIIAAESAGLAEALGDRVLDLALGAASTWPAHMTVSVNISARELTGRDLRTRVETAMRRYDFDPARLVLEITESSILSAGPSALAELEQLRHRGVKVAIDDFGTAYATLQNLTTLPVDELKVDASFTAGLPDKRTHTAVVHGVASMAYELDIPCVIEGVETQAQLDAIRGMSLQAQGWLWGTPRGPEHVPSSVVDVTTPEPGLPRPRPGGRTAARSQDE